jgi:HAE1 family hydrophobic/amphiphilic exporter-1
VTNVEEALLIGALLTVLVVFVFLNSWRSTVITGLALPVSVMASFIAVWAFGFTLNTMSLLGLSLAIGILIDDAIVVRENIVRHIEMGKDHMTASHEGTDEIGLAVAATTFSIVAVFVPVAFMYGVAGQWFKPFALTIAASVLVSLFVSFSLDPMLSAYWADPQVEAGEHRNPIARTLEKFNHWFNRMAQRYKGLIAWALDHRVAVVLLALASFVIALALPAVGLVGASFFGAEDQSEVNIAIETPPGSNLAYTRIKAEEAARMARVHKEVRFTFTTLGGSTGTSTCGWCPKPIAASARRNSAGSCGRKLGTSVARLCPCSRTTFRARRNRFRSRCAVARLSSWLRPLKRSPSR